MISYVIYRIPLESNVFSRPSAGRGGGVVQEGRGVIIGSLPPPTPGGLSGDGWGGGIILHRNKITVIQRQHKKG